MTRTYGVGLVGATTNTVRRCPELSRTAGSHGRVGRLSRFALEVVDARANRVAPGRHCRRAARVVGGNGLEDRVAEQIELLRLEPGVRPRNAAEDRRLAAF